MDAKKQVIDYNAACPHCGKRFIYSKSICNGVVEIVACSDCAGKDLKRCNVNMGRSHRRKQGW